MFRSVSDSFSRFTLANAGLLSSKAGIWAYRLSKYAACADIASSPGESCARSPPIWAAHIKERIASIRMHFFIRKGI